MRDAECVRYGDRRATRTVGPPYAFRITHHATSRCTHSANRKRKRVSKQIRAGRWRRPYEVDRRSVVGTGAGRRGRAGGGAGSAEARRGRAESAGGRAEGGPEGGRVLRDEDP